MHGMLEWDPVFSAQRDARNSSWWWTDLGYVDSAAVRSLREVLEDGLKESFDGLACRSL